MVYNLCVLNKYPRTSADGSSSPSSSYLSSISDVASMLPSHLSSAQLHEPRQTRFKAEAAFLNSQYPPQSKINGIKETRGPWCYRWSSLDKIDVFCAFLRHYLTLSAHYLHEKPLLAVDQLHVFALPGFLCILTHIYEITDFQLRQRAVQKQQQQQNLAINARVPGVPTSSSTQSVPPAPVAIVATANPALPPPAMPSPAIDKILRLVRDFLSNPHSVSEPLIRRGVVKGFENIIKLLVCQTRLLETVMVDQVFELFINFVKGIKSDSNADDFLDWPFWIDTCLKLLESRSIACEIRALCILYQCWDYIPNYQTDKLHSSQFQPIKYQLSLRLSGDQVWNSLFGHYLPLVRSFYIRLLVWKILGPDSMDLQGSRRLSSFRDSINRAKILQVVSSQLARTYSLTKDTTFRPSDPVLNRRMVIKATEAANNQEKKEAIRTLPYEILDDAAYSCANLSVSDNQSAGGAESISSLSSSNDLYTLGSAGTIPDSSEVSSKQKPNTSSSTSKRPSKLASGWMSRLFRHKGHEGAFSRNHSAGSAGSERLPTNSANSTGSSQIRTLFNHTRSSSANVSQSDASSVCSIPRSTSTPLLKELQKEDDGSLEAFESILQTPPRILSSSGSSPSISSKSSSPSLLSSMASLSSPQSSTSSLDFLDQFTSSSKYIRSIQQLQSQKKHQSMKFVPPELNFVVPELTEPAYRFELVTNDLRVSASYQSLRELNNPSGKRFIRQMTPILNSPPRLPSLASSTDSEIDDDTDIDIDVMEGNLDDIQTSLRLNDDSIDLLKPEPILRSYSGVSTPDSSVYFSAMNTPEVEESDTFNASSTIIHSANDFANGVYEYNVCVREFEQFVRNRLKDHQVHAQQTPLCSGFQPSNLVSRFAGCSRSSNDSIDNSVNGLLIYQDFADKLREQVPVLTPEEKGGY
ncbi:DEKNAAC100998 [Brettanomyces naardenensis]|uniref:DEKNAAC100998 n=1 Tax=Brettanomyces naardenensis TaxID=13370 RepID=A0A448YH72_BRENA|nr:DEKNAAC100998 [Brettanomyces naardenensis]